MIQICQLTIIYLQKLQELNAFIARSQDTLQLYIARQNFKDLLRVLTVMAEIRQREPYADNVFKPLKDIMALLKSYNVEFELQLLRSIEQLPLHWQQLKQQALTKQEALQETRHYQQQRVAALIGLHTCHVQHYAKQFQRMPVNVAKFQRATFHAPAYNHVVYLSSLSLCYCHAPTLRRSVLSYSMSRNLRCLR